MKSKILQEKFMFNFEGQTVLVTGGTRGIGRGIAQAFLQSGARVIATFKSNQKGADDFLKENEAFANNLFVKKCDVTDENSIAELFAWIEQDFEALQVLVNNSGVRQDALGATMESAQWDAVIDTNLKGTFLMGQKAILNFMKNRYGRIINITSIGARLGLPGQGNYAASKAGQEALSKSWAKEVAKKGITVNNIAPGFIETDFISELPQDQLKEYKKTVPMKRFGKVQEVAHAALFLASADAAYITGSTLEIAGGL
jgi:3-oxoacyl-[acyl-carrier protein] reductase